MIYFTDMMLIPGDGNSSSELKKAMAGTGMVRCSQVEAQPDLELDVERVAAEYNESWSAKRATGKYGPTPYSDDFARKLNAMMNAKDTTLEYDTGGAWGGPGGWSEYGGHLANEPEVTSVSGVADDTPVVVHFINGDFDEAHDIVMDLSDNSVPGAKWEIGPMPDSSTLKVYWAADPEYRDEPDPGPDSFDEY